MVLHPWDDSPACSDLHNAICTEDSTFQVQGRQLSSYLACKLQLSSSLFSMLSSILTIQLSNFIYLSSYLAFQILVSSLLAIQLSVAIRQSSYQVSCNLASQLYTVCSFPAFFLSISPAIYVAVYRFLAIQPPSYLALSLSNFLTLQLLYLAMQHSVQPRRLYIYNIHSSLTSQPCSVVFSLPACTNYEHLSGCLAFWLPSYLTVYFTFYLVISPQLHTFYVPYSISISCFYFFSTALLFLCGSLQFLCSLFVHYSFISTISSFFYIVLFFLH